MIKNIKTIGLSFLLFFMAFSTLNAEKVKTVIIEGTIQNASSNVIYLNEFVNNQMVKLDSAILKNNTSFSFKTAITKTNYFQLVMDKKEYTLLILEPGEQLKIKLDANQMMKPSEVIGSKNTEQIFKILNVVSNYDQKMDSINKAFNNITDKSQRDSLEPILYGLYQNVDKDRVEYLRNEFKNNPGLACLLFTDKVSIDQNLDIYEVLDKFLMAKYADNQFVNDFHSKVYAKINLAPGKMAPEIKLLSPDDKIITLSSLKGQIVMIDFWASWCRPCRASNPGMVELYAKYHSKGFEILGVSLDDNKQNWIGAIQADKLTWLHVSDLKKWNNEAAHTYAVESIPQTFLIDKEGKIIASGLREEALRDKLKEIFGE